MVDATFYLSTITLNIDFQFLQLNPLIGSLIDESINRSVRHLSTSFLTQDSRTLFVDIHLEVCFRAHVTYILHVQQLA